MKNKFRHIWAISREMWGDVAEPIIRYYIAINFGKDSIKGITEDELKKLMEWLEIQASGTGG